MSRLISISSRFQSLSLVGGKSIIQPQFQLHQSNISRRFMGHTVRLIALQDLPHGKAYRGDVLEVKAGYARNYLIPQKMALYATPQNFDRLEMIDPDVETDEQRLERIQRQSTLSAQEDQFLKEADLLKKYLKNKVVSVCSSVLYVWMCV